MDEKQRAKCMRYMSRVLTLIPPQQEHNDASHASVVYFGVLSLSLLGATPPSSEVLHYLRLVRTSNGFKMSPSYLELDTHLTATYFCLALHEMSKNSPHQKDALLINTNRVMNFVTSCQSPSGNFSATPLSTECSLRHTYSAFAVARILNYKNKSKEKWVDLSLNYILSCQNYDGGFGDRPGDESHAGLTFCAVACLKMGGAISRANKMLYSYLAKRQTSLGGHNGRPNKETDVCYSFWVLCSVKILGIPVSPECELAVRKYLLGPGFDDLLGGFVKIAGEHADPYHTALALCALACLEGRFDPLLSMPSSA